MIHRAARLERLEAFLRSRGTTNVGEAARELEVSPRTLFRDLAALRERGVIVEGESGPGGGLRVDLRSTMTTVRFPSEEVVALWLSAELSRLSGTLPWGKSADAALDRVFAALPLPRRKELRELFRRVVVGEPASETLRKDAGRAGTDVVRVFEQAFTARLGMRFGYVDRHGKRSQRVVEPHGLLLLPPLWYVLGVDVDKGAARMFRMDRFVSPEVARAVTFVPRREVIDELLAAEGIRAHAPKA